MLHPRCCTGGSSIPRLNRLTSHLGDRINQQSIRLPPRPLPHTSHRRGSSTVTHAMLHPHPRRTVTTTTRRSAHLHHPHHYSSCAQFTPTPCHSASLLTVSSRSGRCRMSVICGNTGKRRRLIKTRVVRPYLRGKRKFADEPHRLTVSSSSPEYAGRLTTAINSTNGPLQMEYLLREHGLNFTATQVTMALGRLAGFASTGAQLSIQRAEALQRTAEKCLLLLQQPGRMAQCDHVGLARVAAAMGVLSLQDKAVCVALAEGCERRLGLFKPDTMAGLVGGLATLGHNPGEEWLERFCMEVYARFSLYNGRELSTLMYSLHRLGWTPRPVWLDRCMELFRGSYGISTDAPALARFVYSLAKMKATPSPNWLQAFSSEARRRIDSMSSKELPTLLWSLAGLGYSPDAVFMECWYRCCSKRMQLFSADQLLLSLQALAAMGSGPLPARYSQAVLMRLQALSPSLSELDMSQLGWSIASLRIKPDEAWMEMFITACEPCLPSLSIVQLADLMWALARLRYQPGEAWMALLYTQLKPLLTTAPAAQLGLIVWAVRRLQYQPPPPLVTAFMDAAVKVYTKRQIADVDLLLGGLAQGHGGSSSSSSGSSSSSNDAGESRGVSGSSNGSSTGARNGSSNGSSNGASNGSSSSAGDDSSSSPGDGSSNSAGNGSSRGSSDGSGRGGSSVSQDGSSAVRTNVNNRRPGQIDERVGKPSGKLGNDSEMGRIWERNDRHNTQEDGRKANHAHSPAQDRISGMHSGRGDEQNSRDASSRHHQDQINDLDQNHDDNHDQRQLQGQDQYSRHTRGDRPTQDPNRPSQFGDGRTVRRQAGRAGGSGPHVGSNDENEERAAAPQHTQGIKRVEDSRGGVGRIDQTRQGASAGGVSDRMSSNNMQGVADALFASSQRTGASRRR